MADATSRPVSSGLEPLRRFVPLAAWAVVVLTLIFIPLKIVGYGYLPGDDALREAAKAVSGKPWSAILVLNPVYTMDNEFGWAWLLRHLHLWTQWNPEPLVVFSVVALFVLAGATVLPWLRRPEAWLGALILISITSDLTDRLMYGRPFAITVSAVMAILLAWHRLGDAPPAVWTVLGLTATVGFAVFFHGVWYLWVLLIAAFFLAGQFRWGAMLTAAWVAGSLLGAALTGHPVAYLLEAVKIVIRALGMNETQRTLVSELQPLGGDFYALLLLGGVIVLRHLGRLNCPPLHRNPAFWLAALTWVLACETRRFWEDWGAPALLVLMMCDLQLLFQTRLAADSFKRLGLVCGLAVAAYAVTTNDVGSRWTSNLTWQYLTTDNKDLAGWMPGKGGILYSADMTIFYQTFYKNPKADWRYILGFEPTLMPDADFKVYHSILWNFFDYKAYAPWVKKMRPQDRLVIRGSRGSPPNIPQLEWNYGVSGIWIGRTPRPVQKGTAPPTLPAKTGSGK